MSNTNTSTQMAVASTSATTPQAPPPTNHHLFNLIKANDTRTLEHCVCPPRDNQIWSDNEVMEGRLTCQQRRVLVEAWRREYLEEKGGYELMEGAVEQGGPGALLTLSGVLFEAMVGRRRNFFHWRRDKKGKRKFCGPSALDRNLHKLWMAKFWPARVILKRTNKGKKVSKQERLALARKKFVPKRSPLRQAETVEHDMGMDSDVHADGDLDESFDTSSIDTQPFDELEYRSRLAMVSGEDGLVVDGERPQSCPDSKVNATEPGPETPTRGGTQRTAQPAPLPTPPPTPPDEESKPVNDNASLSTQEDSVTTTRTYTPTTNAVFSQPMTYLGTLTSSGGDFYEEASRRMKSLTQWMKPRAASTTYSLSKELTAVNGATAQDSAGLGSPAAVKRKREDGDDAGYETEDEAPSRRRRSNSWTPPDSSLPKNWVARSKRKRDDAAEDSASFSFERSRSDVWDPNASFYDVSTSSQFLKSNGPSRDVPEAGLHEQGSTARDPPLDNMTRSKRQRNDDAEDSTAVKRSRSNSWSPATSFYEVGTSSAADEPKLLPPEPTESGLYTRMGKLEDTVPVNLTDHSIESETDRPVLPEVRRRGKEPAVPQEAVTVTSQAGHLGAALVVQIGSDLGIDRGMGRVGGDATAVAADLAVHLAAVR
ncbi:hypothetical protein QBC46DRAFT_338496 [Diplogelasinospora grovesii]|uniref:Uncharacterized protein n=1 Tax=Diplogelasinospora grovesii TaxID=303347 RepID=A0AAN6S731_9PEZI|nr:hypothetical protein QBC46DRAFT_338496 [Diplogelasinospora grovesii]